MGFLSERQDLGCLIETKPCQPPREDKEKKRPGWENTNRGAQDNGEGYIPLLKK